MTSPEVGGKQPADPYLKSAGRAPVAMKYYDAKPEGVPITILRLREIRL